MSAIQVVCCSRLHISLLDMSANGYRQNGGLGFFVNGYDITVKIEFHPENFVLDTRDTSISCSTFLIWIKKFLLKNNIQKKFKITISGVVPSHMGFGVSTAIRMACTEGIYKLLNKDMSNDEIIRQSHRGGTSGIGVYGYFSGGFIFDLGHEPTRISHAPSRSHESSSHLPLLLNRLNMPDWELGILIPKTISHKTHKEEIEFFNRTCPIDNVCVYETIYHALFGVLASVQTENFDTFCCAINSLQEQSWKKAERALYPELRKYEYALKCAGAQAIGMSSLGPSLYFFSNKIDQVIIALNSSPLNNDFEVFKASPCNHGRVISYV